MMMYRVLGATLLLCVAFGENVQDLKAELQRMKSQVAGLHKTGSDGSASSDTTGGDESETLAAKDDSYPKELYQRSADQRSNSGNYQKYMKRYGKSGNYTQYMKNYQQYIKKYAGGESGHQTQGDYQQYLSKYAEGNGQGSSYQQYMDKYAGQGGSQGDYKQYYSKYMNKYAQNSGYQQYADYQMYIERYSKHLNQEEGSVRSAHDANTTAQLKKWRETSNQNVEWYCPAEYSQYANNNIARQYNKRHAELEKTNSGSGSAQVDDTINLAAVEHSGSHLLQNDANELKVAVDKAEKMGDNLKRATNDYDGIKYAAAMPAMNVAAVYSDRSEKLGKEIRNIQEQAKSKKNNAHLENQLRQSIHEVKQLRDDELKALNRAHHDAETVMGHAARGAQTEVRKQARLVRATLHHLASKDGAYQAEAEKLQNRMHAAADRAEDQTEELARIMKQHLQDNLASARDEVRNQADRQFDDLQEALSFLAESEEENVSTGLFGLLALGSFAITLGVVFAKRSAQSINLQQPMLG